MGSPALEAVERSGADVVLPLGGMWAAAPHTADRRPAGVDAVAYL